MTVATNQRATAGRLPLLAAVEPRAPASVVVRWADAERPVAVVDLSDLLLKGGVFSPLRDPGTFARVRLGTRRRTIEWPEPADDAGDPIVEIDAESLLLRAARDDAGANRAPGDPI